MLVGISGKIKSGKDTVGTILWNNSVNDFSPYRYAFAYNLKKIVASIVGCYHGDLDDQDFKLEYIPNFMKITKDGITTHIVPSSNIFYKDIFRTYEAVTYREALQFFGNKFRSEYGQDFWIKMLEADLIDNSCDTKGLHIITDVRYRNEADFVKSNQGILIRVNRPEAQSSKKIATHPSETDLDDYLGFDYIIENDGTLEELKDKMKLIYLSIKQLKHC